MKRFVSQVTEEAGRDMSFTPWIVIEAPDDVSADAVTKVLQEFDLYEEGPGIEEDWLLKLQGLLDAATAGSWTVYEAGYAFTGE